MQHEKTVPRRFQEQVAIAEDNLTRFTEYFTDTWIKAEFLRRFHETVASNHLTMKYEPWNTEDTHLTEARSGKSQIGSIS